MRLSAIALAQLCMTAALAADTASWRSRKIYFALTDRIARTSGDSGGNQCSNLGNYCGGTFAGLESKLDYISGMGFDAIWITPVITNSEGGYHGYWAMDLYSINSNYGTSDDLKSLVNAAHDKGMYVMVDVVANHMGQANIQDNSPDLLKESSSYHTECEIDYSNQDSVENCWIAGLPDLNTESAEVQTLYQDWIQWLVSEFSFDGIRIDTVKHVDKEFWPPFVLKSAVYSIGEVWDGDASYLADYAPLMSGLLNYAVYYPLTRFFTQTGSSQDLVDTHNQLDDFPDPTAMGTFLDNHDNARWLSANGDTSLLKNALAYVILARGVPIVYYGTEQGFSGGADPNNREDLWRTGYDTDADLYQAIARLNGARDAAGGLAGDDHEHLYVADTAYAWSRAGGDLVVLTSNSGSGTSAEHCFNSQVPNGSWNNVFGEGTYTADGSGNVCVTITNGEPVVLLAS
ncbi:glycoside hydrolase superfamily [Xylariomycetidae sp. FL2044]|nr:glycoside hydrolase superfamily [Xylariomycetidae sp. FL2044]